MRHDAAVYGRDRRRLAPLGLALALFGFVISPLVHAIVVHGHDLGAVQHGAWIEDAPSSELPAHNESAANDEDTWHYDTPSHDEDTRHHETASRDESRSHRQGRHGHTHRDGNLEHLGACFVPALCALDLPAPHLVSLQRIIGRARPSITARIRFPEVPQGP